MVELKALIHFLLHRTIKPSYIANELNQSIIVLFHNGCS